MGILDYITITPELADSFVPLIPPSVLEALRGENALGLGCLLGDIPNGALVFEPEGHTARLLSLYVDQYDRRNGTGRFLVETLRGILKDTPGIYSIRATLPGGDDAAAAFFTALGARLETLEGGLSRFPLSALESSPLLAAPASPCCVSGETLSQDALIYYQRTLQKSGMDLMRENLWEPPVRRDLSWYYQKDKAIHGCVVMTETETGLCLAMMVNQGDMKILPVLLGTLLRHLMKTCPPETEIALEAATPETRKVLSRLVPNAVKTTRHVAVLPV